MVKSKKNIKDKSRAAPTLKETAKVKHTTNGTANLYLTHNIFIKTTSPLFDVVDSYAFLCKNLKNSSLYVFRQTFFSENRTINKYELINFFTETKQVDYCAIPRKVAQQVIFQVAQEFKSFWGLMKLYGQAKEQQRSKSQEHGSSTVAKMSKPNLPKYLHKEKGRANIIFTNQAVSKKDLANGILTLSSFDKSRPISLKLGKLSKVITAETLKEVRIVKAPNGYNVKIIYSNVGAATKQKSQQQQRSDTDDTHVLSTDNSANIGMGGEGVAVNKILRALSIDFGVNNLMTVANNTDMRPIIFSGKPLKSFNQHFNKELAKLHEQLDKAKNSFVKTRIQKEINKLYQKREHKVNDFLHKASRQLINHAVHSSNGIDTIVVGYNAGWKQEIKSAAR